MRKFVAAVVTVFLASLALTVPASAQDAHIGTVTADPAAVPEAGEYTVNAVGSDWLPDTSILLVKCVSPAATLVPGVSTADEIGAAALAIDAFTDCDLAAAVPIEVDGDGAWTAELTADVGDNFFLSAGALDGSQAGATWIPIVDPAVAAAAAEAEAAAAAEAEAAAEEEAAAEAEAAEEEAAEEEAAAEEPAELPNTGVESSVLAIVGTAMLAGGVMIAAEARRHR